MGTESQTTTPMTIEELLKQTFGDDWKDHPERYAKREKKQK